MSRDTLSGVSGIKFIKINFIIPRFCGRNYFIKVLKPLDCESVWDEKKWDTEFNQQGSIFIYLFLTYLLTYLLTHTMEQSPSWEAKMFSDSQEIPWIVFNPKVH
jgi:hypothetical protein